jgi:hypothetical protein
MSSKIDANYQYAVMLNTFLDSLLKFNDNTYEMRELLLKRKFEAIDMLIYTKDVYENNKKLLTNQTVEQEKQLLERIGKLPQDIRKYIGKFSNVVINQKKLVRIEFYNNWFNQNNTRITQLLSSWSKPKLAFVLSNIKSVYNNYYNNCKSGTELYKKGTALMFRSKIETLIKIKGQRSNFEKYCLLLAIENCHNKKI